MHHDLHKVKMHLLYPHSCSVALRFECVFVFKLISFYALTHTANSRINSERECKSGNSIVNCFLFNSIECRHKAIMPRVCVCVCWCCFRMCFFWFVCFCFSFHSFLLSFAFWFRRRRSRCYHNLQLHMYAPYKWSIDVHQKRAIEKWNARFDDDNIVHARFLMHFMEASERVGMWACVCVRIWYGYCLPFGDKRIHSKPYKPMPWCI